MYPPRLSLRFPSLLVDRGIAGLVARRLVPAAIVVPIAVGIFHFYGDGSTLLASPMARSIYVLASIAVLLWVVTWVVGILARSDHDRAQSLMQAQIARQ